MRTFPWPEPRRIFTFLGLALAVTAMACSGARDASTRPCAPAGNGPFLIGAPPPLPPPAPVAPAAPAAAVASSPDPTPAAAAAVSVPALNPREAPGPLLDRCAERDKDACAQARRRLDEIAAILPFAEKRLAASRKRCDFGCTYDDTLVPFSSTYFGWESTEEEQKELRVDACNRLKALKKARKR